MKINEIVRVELFVEVSGVLKRIESIVLFISNNGDFGYWSEALEIFCLVKGSSQGVSFFPLNGSEFVSALNDSKYFRGGIGSVLFYNESAVWGAECFTIRFL